jgi:hypothetical protein
MRFKDISFHKGNVKIIKDYGDKEETVYESNNVVVSGMGEVLASIMSQEFSALPKIDLFQIGVSGTSSLEVSSTNKLGSSLTLSSYGVEESVLLIKALQNINNNKITSYFLPIQDSNLVLVDEEYLEVSLVVGKDIGNGYTLNEVGLFSKPVESQESYSLIAYNTFPSITKEEEYSLIFEWSLQL